MATLGFRENGCPKNSPRLDGSLEARVFGREMIGCNVNKDPPTSIVNSPVSTVNCDMLAGGRPLLDSRFRLTSGTTRIAVEGTRRDRVGYPIVWGREVQL